MFGNGFEPLSNLLRTPTSRSFVGRALTAAETGLEWRCTPPCIQLCIQFFDPGEENQND
jgi:hypothetical protein